MEDRESSAGAASVAPTSPSARLLETLQLLIELPSAELGSTLCRASDVIARATGADKVDAFLYDPRRDSLVALGTSDQPVSAKQRALGLDVLPLSNGGRVVHVYTTGQTFVCGHLEDDADELRGIKEGLGIRSTLGVPLVVGGARRGTIMLASLQPEFFAPDDVRFMEAVAPWIGAVAHRAELVEEISRNAAEQGRRAGAEELVTVVAHDLRNLAVPIDLSLHVLRRRADRDGRRDDVGDIDTAQRALGRLRSLTSDILDVARIERGLFHGTLEPLDLVALTHDIARTLTSPSQPVQVRVRATKELIVAADAARIRQCLENLVANAIQQSPKDAGVDVLLSHETRDNGMWAIVEVIDQGPGVPEHLIPHLFDRFVSGRLREGGLGLGLHLAKEIAAMHGGELTVDRSARRGARFVLTLPCHGEC
jgi:signal transduction histidine kinase